MAGKSRKLREKEQRKKKKQQEREIRKKAFEAKIKLGTNSKRKFIAKRKGDGKIVRDFKEPSQALFSYVPPSRFASEFWS